MLSNKTWLAVLAAATTVFSSLSADYWNNNGVPNCGTPCCDPCASGTFGVRADFLYWQAKEEGLEVFGIVPSVPSLIPIITPEPFSASTTIGFPKLRWDPGFRVGLDYAAPCNGWEADILWTHYNTTAKRTSFFDFSGNQAGSAIVLYPIIFTALPANSGVAGSTTATSLTATSSWKLNYNVVDLTFGKDYCITSCAHLRPYFGARGAWINQKYNRNNLVETGDPASGQPEETHLFSAFGDSKYSAGGVVVGTDASYTLGGGFGLYGNFLGSLLYGKYRVKELFTGTVLDPVPTSGFNPLGFALNRDYFKVRANLETSAGVQYLYNIPCSTQSLLVRVGYELVYWFGQNQFRARVPVNESQNSDLWFQGLTVTAKYNF